MILLWGSDCMDNEEKLSALEESNAPVSAFDASYKIEVTGNFRGYWRNVQDSEENGNAVSFRRLKITRGIRYNGKAVRQVAWLSEADAKAHGLVDGVKYHLTLSVGKTLMPMKTNGTGRLDEYVFADAKIVSVSRH